MRNVITNNETLKYFREGKISELSLGQDKYYCKPEIAKHLISLIDLSEYEHIIEPSAGNGSFSLQIYNCEPYDLYPEHSSIKKANFFDLSFNYDKSKTLVIGGPPFGRNSENAFKFIQHASLFADTIAFILPNQFKEESHRNKGVPIDLECVFEIDLEEESFTIDGYLFSYPCVFQIYKKIL